MKGAKKIFREIKKCLNCQGSVKFLGPTIVDSDVKCDLVRCIECNHWMINPILKQEYLDYLYFEKSPLVLGEEAATNYVINSDKPIGKHWILEYLATKDYDSVLEIGPGDGRLLKQFQILCKEVHGVDPGQYLKEKYIVSRLEDLPKKEFDVLIFQDVLEHMSNPFMQIRKYRKYMSEKCRIFVAVPCCESLEARILRAKWKMISPFGHLNFFSSVSITDLLQSLGSETIQLRKVSIIPSKSKHALIMLKWILTFPLQFLKFRVKDKPYRRKLGEITIGCIGLISRGDQIYAIGEKGFYRY